MGLLNSPVTFPFSSQRIDPREVADHDSVAAPTYLHAQGIFPKASNVAGASTPDLGWSTTAAAAQDNHNHNSFGASEDAAREIGHKSRKRSFAFNTTLDEFRSLPWRSAREQSSRKWFSRHSQEPVFSTIEGGIAPEELAHISHHDPMRQNRAKSSSWLRRVTSMTFGHQRQPSLSNSPDGHVSGYNFRHGTAIPQIGLDAPKTSYPMGGASARAAAAAQNEVLESARTFPLREPSRLMEPNIASDTESGIGIDVRERSATDLAFPIIRKDPSLTLPEELLSHVMSHLDALSLMRAELVSRRWNATARASHTWQNVFAREYSPAPQSDSSPNMTSQVGGRGLGKERSNQDWKETWKVRKQLHTRWVQGRAAAIYLQGHKDSVYCAQFDENKILTGSRDRTIRIWDARTYECIKVLGVPKTTTHAHVHDPLVNHITCGQKPTVSVFPPTPTTELIPPEAPSIFHDGSILCLQFDPQIMVTGSSDHTCIIWDILDDYKPIKQLRCHSAGVLDVCFDDKHVVSCSKDTLICLWDRQTGDLLRTLTGHRGPVNAVQLRGNLIVSASGDGVAKLWNLASGLCIKEFPSRDRGLACVEFSLDSRTILAGGNDQVIYQFDANTGELVRELKGHRGLVRSLHLDSANGRVISGSYDTSVRAHDLHTGEMLCDFSGWTTSWMLSAKADYRRIVATSQDSRAIIMDFGYMLPGIELLEG